jgi:dihydropteroate synthase
VTATEARAPHRSACSTADALVDLLHGPRPLVCGILNVTPDSFSDGGSYRDHGKTLEHNLTLLRSLRAFEDLDAPIMAGLSRKAMLGQITGRDVRQRVTASVTAAVLAVQRGAKILRVHDVAATNDALKVVDALGCLRGIRAVR